MKVKKPCGHRVTVKLKKLETLSAGGIDLSATVDRRHQLGVEAGHVVHIGETAFKAYDDGNPWCAVGDLVGIVQYSGLHYEDGGDIYRVVNDIDIVCVLEEGEIDG